MNNPLIKNIIFDLAEVLLTGIKDTGLALAEKHQLNVKSDHTADWTNGPTPLLVPLVKEFFNGNVNEDEYVKQVLELYPQIGHAEWLKQHIRENFKEVEGTRDIIVRLKKLGYKLALLSVHGEEWVEYLEKKFDYHKLFDVLSYSYETKVSKPDPLSFKHVLEKLKAPPEECLFIDDSYKNVAVAKELGINAILFTSAKDLEKDLRELGIIT